MNPAPRSTTTLFEKPDCSQFLNLHSHVQHVDERPCVQVVGQVPGLDGPGPRIHESVTVQHQSRGERPMRTML